MTKVLLSGAITWCVLVLIVVGLVGVLAVSDAAEIGSPGPGGPCTPNSSYSKCPDHYVCKKKSAAATNFTCECAWGETEVGLFNIKKDVSICALIAGQGGGVGALLWFMQQAITAVMALTIMAAVVSIVIGGYIYMTAGGDADRVRTAKVWIGSAILGIILYLESHD